MLAGFLVILGVRFALIERFSSTVPLADEWLFMDVLEQWAHGQRDWAWLFERHNGTHLTFFSRLLPALSVEMNGLWDARLDSFLHALVYAGLAMVLAQFFARIVPQRAMLMRGLVLFFFAVPFAGVRATWAFLSCFDFAGIFAFLAFSVQAWHGERKWSLPVACLLAVAASFSLGSGCLAGLAMAGVPVLESFATRRIERRSLLWSVSGLAIFLGFYLTMGKPTASDPTPFVLTQSISAALKAFAWPVFIAPLAVSALVPFALLMWRYFRGDDDSRGDPRMKALLLAWAWLLLQAAAIGFMRGENGNHGIPSNRYNDLLMPFVFVEAATLLFLRNAAPSCRRILIVRNAWVLLVVAGVSLHLLWRTWPFMAHENGEYNEWVRQRNVREFFRGNLSPLINAQKEVKGTSAIYMIGDRLEPLLNEIGAGKWKIKTVGSMAGIPLTFRAGDEFEANAVPPEYFVQPPLQYFGSFSKNYNLESWTGMAATEEFEVKGDFLTFDLIVDNKARFTNYALPGLDLRLVRNDGATLDLLAELRRQPPFLLRDRESVCVGVSPGKYHLECRDDSKDFSLAFSSPMEGGACAGVLHLFIQSSKLLIAAGIALLAWLGLTSGSQGQRPDTSQPGATPRVKRQTTFEP